MPQPKSSPAEVSIYAVIAIMKVSPNWTRFEANMNRAFQTAGGSTTLESDTWAAIPPPTGSGAVYVDHRQLGNVGDAPVRVVVDVHPSRAAVAEPVAE